MMEAAVPIVEQNVTPAAPDIHENGSLTARGAAQTSAPDNVQNAMGIKPNFLEVLFVLGITTKLMKEVRKEGAPIDVVVGWRVGKQAELLFVGVTVKLFTSASLIC